MSIPKHNPFTHKLIAVPLTEAELAERQEQRYRQGAARPDETCEQRNIRMGWGCKCHGMSFCPDLELSHIEDDVPVFRRKDGGERDVY